MGLGKMAKNQLCLEARLGQGLTLDDLRSFRLREFEAFCSNLKGIPALGLGLFEALGRPRAGKTRLILG